MPRRLVIVLTLFTAAILAVAHVSATPRASGVVAHEWGTFTTVAGEDGLAANWVPLGGPTDLPCFVQCYQNRLIKVWPDPEQDAPLDYEAARAALVGRVRMETPVIYFYSPAETTVSVSVRFPQGLITEWYPAATVTQPAVTPRLLENPAVVARADWPLVWIRPGATPSLPHTGGNSHYYAARHTDAAPIRIGDQDEKFLFYRGVANFPSPIAATLQDDGRLHVRNLGRDPIPHVMVFENRAGQLRFRHHGALARDATLDRPTTPATMASLRGDLVRVLVEIGLYEREAEAMVDTWRDSWFEEGLRVFHLIPQASVDAILPLTISPAPASVARAFVGRMEIITPEAVLRAQMALAANDLAALEAHGRFLGPIAERLMARASSVSERSRIRAVTNAVFASYVKRVAGCQ